MKAASSSSKAVARAELEHTIAVQAEVISLKIFDSFGGGASYSKVIDAVNYATSVINQNGLDKTKCVINMSLGGGFSSGLDQAVRNAANQGIKFSIAAGNAGSDADFWSPASAGDHPNVYTVSAVDNQYRMASWSNWDDPNGGDDVDVAAPGVRVCCLTTKAAIFAISAAHQWQHRMWRGCC